MARIFLCHANEDKASVREVYQQLKALGFAPWLDEVDILPGQDWDYEIEQALETSDFVMVFLSTCSVEKVGYVQREFRRALYHSEELPEGFIHTIPVKLDDCSVPRRFRRNQWVNLYENGAFDRIVRALHYGLQQRGQPLPESLTHDPSSARPEITPPPILQPPEPTFTNSIGMDFAPIPAGMSMRGIPDSDTEANWSERPAHHVTQITLTQAVDKVSDEPDSRAKDVVSQPPRPVPKDYVEISTDISQQRDAGMSQEQAIALCTDLHDFLETGQWKEADQETARVLLRLTKREKDWWLRAKDIDQLPCAILRVINDLWQHYSDNHRFGFSAQQHVWSEIEGRPGKFDFESFCRFGDQVGWRVDGQWRSRYNDFLFTSDAPPGHLPSLRLPSAEEKEDWWGAWLESFQHFLSRLEWCFKARA